MELVGSSTLRKTGLLLFFIVLCGIFLFSCARARQKTPLYVPWEEKERQQVKRSSPLPTDQLHITSPFRDSRKRGSRYYTHQGIDIKADEGTPVFAVMDGIVIFVGKMGNYGLIICLDHNNGWETRYAHLSRIHVKQHQQVKRGQKIGEVGQTGNATAPHLHFEIRINGKPVDPLPWLKGLRR